LRLLLLLLGFVIDQCLCPMQQQRLFTVEYAGNDGDGW
jgi:hypothetical protein